MIGTGKSIRLCDYKNSQLRSYEVFTYSLYHISYQHQELRLGIIRGILLICQLESGISMSYVQFGHMVILLMMVCNIGAEIHGKDRKVSVRIGQENWTRKRK